jgi:dipeptidyl aminopeptidase/acylaminoacyl peptidase
LGSACSIIFTVDYPDKVMALAPTSAFLSGSTFIESLDEEAVNDWKRVGYREEKSTSKPGLVKRYNWSLAEDLPRHELLDASTKIEVPVLLLVGSEDDVTLLATPQQLYDGLAMENTELHLVNGSRHTFVEPQHLQEIKEIMSNWIKKLSREVAR